MAESAGLSDSIAPYTDPIKHCENLIAIGTDNALWHIWQTAPNNGWSSWASLGGILTSSRAVGRNADGRLEVFVRGTDEALWHIWQLTPGGAWSSWASLGGVII